MQKTIIGMGITTIILAIGAVIQGSIVNLIEGLSQGGEMFIRLIPLLIIAFIVAGLISELIPEELVSKWLGKEASWKGPVLGALAGALVPGGPFFFYPLMATLMISGAEIGTLVSFVAAKTTWSVGRIPLEMAIVGVELTIIRLVITFIFPILIGMFVNTFLSHHTEKIRRDVNKLKVSKESRDNNA